MSWTSCNSPLHFPKFISNLPVIHLDWQVLSTEGNHDFNGRQRPAGLVGLDGCSHGVLQRKNRAVMRTRQVLWSVKHVWQIGNNILPWRVQRACDTGERGRRRSGWPLWPCWLQGGNKSQRFMHTHTRTHTLMNSRQCIRASHHSSASAPAQVPPGNTAHTASWHSHRHLKTNGTKTAVFFALRDYVTNRHKDKLSDKYEVIVSIW